MGVASHLQYLTESGVYHWYLVRFQHRQLPTATRPPPRVPTTKPFTPNPLVTPDREEDPDDAYEFTVGSDGHTAPCFGGYYKKWSPGRQNASEPFVAAGRTRDPSYP